MTTQQVAEQLSITRLEILAVVNRYPHLCPVQRVIHGYSWNTEEIQALQAHLITVKRERRQN